MTTLCALATLAAVFDKASPELQTKLSRAGPAVISVFLAIQVIAYWLASKLLAGNEGGLGKALLTWFVHVGITIVTFFVAGMIDAWGGPGIVQAVVGIVGAVLVIVS